MSDLAHRLIEENKRTKSPFLDLGKCGLTDLNLPEELFKLTWLTNLNIGDYYWDKFRNEWFPTRNLHETNRLSGNALYRLNQLPILHTLGLSSNKIEDIRFLKNLTQLQILNLSDTYVNNIHILENLNQLQLLNLRKSQITHIHFLKNLTQLQTLNLSDNYIKDYSFLENLTKLQMLFLSSNQVKDIRFLRNLTQLRTLNLSSNKIKDICFLENLSLLQTLYLSSNQIKDIHFLENLTKLQMLFLSSNQVKDIRSLRNLTQLRTLHLSSNEIEDIRFLEDLTRLRSLDIRRNQIRQFSGELLQDLPRLHTLYISSNPIKNIPKEHFEGEDKNALSNLRGYFNSLRHGRQLNDEVKLIIVGNTTVGKTSLMQFMREDYFVDIQSSTHGIALKRWSTLNSELRVNIWDFGGQEYYHSTHRLFLDDHAVYVVVWESSTNKESIIPTDIYLAGKPYRLTLEHFPYSYWIDSIRYYAPNSTILLVQSKTDKSGIQNVSDDYFKPGYSVQPPAYHLSIYQANEHKGNPLRPEWTAFQDFKANLIKFLKTDAASYELGIGWIAIRDAIRQLPEARRWMTYAEFERFCQQVVAKVNLQFDESVEMTALLTYLSGAASTILYYSDDARLRDKVFLNPQWVTDTIYDILTYDIRDRKDNPGEFAREQVVRVLTEKGVGELTDTFLTLMKKDRFELIFEKPNCSDEYIAPQYLPDEFHDDKVLEQLRPESPIGFILNYPRFMPKSIFMRFMVRYGDLVSDAYWKYGIVLGKSSQRTVAECQFSKHCITIQTADSSNAPQRLQMFFESLWKLSAKKPEIEISVNGTDFVSIGDLIKNLNRNHEIESKQGNWLEVKSFFHLFGIKQEPTKTATKIMDSKTPEIFFSYAWGDDHETGEGREKIVNELYESLNIDGYKVVRDKMDLGYQGLISEFIKRIGKGDIVIVVISDKYLKSPYCMFELLEIYRNSRFTKDQFAKVIFPIRVESLALNKASVQGSYYDYWENEEKDWKELVNKHRISKAQTETYDMVRRIHNELGDLLGHLSDMNSLTKELLSFNNFTKMKVAIETRIKELEFN